METRVAALVREVEQTHGSTFWYGSPLLAQCSKTSNPDLIRALALRHQGLSNKEAGSCHVLRQTIKKMEGPQFLTLWRIMLKSKEDPVETCGHPGSEVWASAFILGEIGGTPALEKVAQILAKEPERSFLLTRIASHLVTRFFQITDEEQKIMSQVIDVKTGVVSEVPLEFPDILSRTYNDRREANEYFWQIPTMTLQLLQRSIIRLDRQTLNVPKDEFLQALSVFRRREFWKDFQAGKDASSGA